VQIPLSAGSQVVVYIFKNTSAPFNEQATAAQSTIDFWDNPLDDEDWNEA